MSSTPPTEPHTPVVISRGGKAISDEVRRQLIEAHESGVSYHQMTRLYGIKRDTAYRICSGRKFTTKARGGSRGKKIDEVSMNFLLRAVEARVDITLNELRDLLISERGLIISLTTIARCLEDSLIRLNASRPSERESDTKVHKVWLPSQYETGAKVCYVEECEFGIYTARTRGRSVQGLPARRAAGDQWIPRVTLLCAMSPEVGFIHSKFLLGAAEQRQFDEFVGELFRFSFGTPILPGSAKRYLVILGNATRHIGIEDRLVGRIPHNLEMIRLSAKGTEMNPMETIFQRLKSYLKLSLSSHGPVVPTEGQTKVQARKLLLLEMCQNALRKLTTTPSINSCDHVICVVPVVKLEYMPTS